MKNFITYINAILADPIVPKKAKYTTTILMPELDTTEGIYRSLLPSYIINGSPLPLRILILGLTEKMNISHNAKEWMITQKMIEETDHFVFPFVSYPLRPIIAEIREAKPTMKFSYYIDANFYLMPEAYPFAKEYRGAKMIELIEDNIRAVDQVIVTNNSLIDYIINKLQERYPGEKIGTLFHFQRLYVLPDLMKSDYVNAHEKGKIKALIIGDEYQFSDINYIKGIIKDFKCKYKEAVEISILGWDGKRNGKTWLTDQEAKFYPRVPYGKYFELIRHIGPDVLIIPANVNTFNSTSKNYVKFLEAAYLNIPVLAPDIEPYKTLITTNENGFICQNKEAYLFQLETMFTEPAKYEGVLGIAYATASDYIITEGSNVEKLQKIYFPEYGTK